MRVDLKLGGEKPGFCENIRDSRRNSKKPGFLDFARVARNRVFTRILPYSRRNSKKPGFLDFARVARNRVFTTIFGHSRRHEKKPGFLDCGARAKLDTATILGTTNSPVVRQGLKPLPQSESRLKTTEELMSRLQTTFAIRQGIDSLADYRVGEKTRWTDSLN